MILPPLIVHDGSAQALQLVEIITMLAPPSVEVIDTSTLAGRTRVRTINEGLKAGTLDTLTPPFAIGEGTEWFHTALKPEQ